MNPPQPELETERLRLRPLRLDDAPEVQRLAGDYAIAENTLLIPHPYEDGMAEEWIRSHAEKFEQGGEVVYAVTRKSDGRLVGAIGLAIVPEHDRAELGYWIGKPYWGNGYCTEAAQALLEYGFLDRKLNRIDCNHFSRNPASGRVMRKIGMTHEGHQSEHVKKWGEYLDIELYGLLRKHYSP